MSLMQTVSGAASLGESSLPIRRAREVGATAGSIAYTIVFGWTCVKIPAGYE